MKNKNWINESSNNDIEIKPKIWKKAKTQFNSTIKVGLFSRSSVIPGELDRINLETSSINLKQYCEHLLILKIDSNLRVAWDLIILLLILYQALFIPYSIAFAYPKSYWIIVWNFVIDICFFLDIILNFNTSYYQTGQIVSTRSQIAKNYLKTWFLIDLIATIPYEWITSGILQVPDNEGDDNTYQTPHMLRILKMIKIIRSIKLIRLIKLRQILLQMEEMLSNETIAMLVIIFRMLMFTFYTAHWSACGWHLISVSSQEPFESAWHYVYFKDMQEQMSDFDKYISCLYWSFTTMITVGYGDIIPKSRIEYIYTILTMLMACGFFAYVVGTVSNIISTATAFENEWRDIALTINHYMRQKKFPRELKFKVQRYLDYVYQYKRKNQYGEMEIMNLLQGSLKYEVFNNVKGKVLANFPLFEDDSFTQLMTGNIIRVLKSEILSPSDIVFVQGETHRKMFFIQSGSILLFHQKFNLKFKELKHSQYFGEVCLFTGHPRSASAMSLGFTELFSISYAGLIKTVQQSKADQIKLAQIERLCANGNYSRLQVKCFICKKLGHIALQCTDYILNMDQEKYRQSWLRGRTSSKVVNSYDIDLSSKRRVKRLLHRKYRPASRDIYIL